MGHVVSIPVLFVSGLAVACAFPMVLGGIIAVAIVKAVYQYAVTTSQEVIEQNVPMLKRRREEEDRSRQERERQAALAAEKLQAEISAEIEAEIARRKPQTVEEATQALEQAREDIKSLEAEAASAEAVAKEKSGGWAELADARERLTRARANAVEASALLEEIEGTRLLEGSTSAGGVSSARVGGASPCAAAGAGAGPPASRRAGAGVVPAARAAAAGQREALLRGFAQRQRGPQEVPGPPRVGAAALAVAPPPPRPFVLRAARPGAARSWGLPVARALRGALRRV